ncbi:ATP-dependent nuclease [Microbulbifer zhoushanensis]|uniref:ATP-dependent nuclease n=1 Tax=Microbulbifer zhoushanensis TaxID=2904254 RepID=UPI001F409C3E|nr:AAA family ATPase [Microbulbifer zhoushanensis]
MSIQITKIDIHNFRSARDLSINPARLAVLVGKNDSGKSNILRALNLFFNGKTDQENYFNFSVDHNIHNKPNRRAKEISIKIELILPDNYRRVNGDVILWEKRWRSGGQVFNKYVGRRRVAGPRGGISWEDVQIPERSNVHSLLRNINYVYVPAIKDPEYFSELRASIYDVIADVADREFRDSSHDFERSISNQLQDLTAQITSSLGFQSRLALPRDLSHIFESLDFLSNKQNISLDARGDGVKARHIPLILKFMADKKRSLQGRGAQPYTYIWGYEEPENSLELLSSVELADQFWEFANDGIAQVFLTTHSPVFYNLHLKQREDESQISCHHMYHTFGEDGTKETQELTNLDERMGTTAMFAPMVAELEDQVRRKELAKAEVEAMARANRRKLFVEGPSDKLILEKALSVFAPVHSKEIDVETRDSGGHLYVIDMLLSWRSRAKHHPELPRAAGLLDLDAEAKRAADEWNKISDNIKSAKCFKLPKPTHIRPVLKASFKIPVVLETLYDKKAWMWAKERGHLEQRRLSDVIPSPLNDKILTGDEKLEDHLEEDWKIFVTHVFQQVGKAPMARFLSKRPDEEFRERFSVLEPVIKDIVAYLFPDK